MPLDNAWSDSTASSERTLATRHLHNDTLVLYDVTSSYLKGRCCALGRIGYSRDGKKGKLQIVYRLLCNAEELRSVEGLDWISALRSEAIAKLATDLAEIHHPDFPGERLIACLNPLLREEHGRKREALLRATERELDKIVVATQRRRRALRGESSIALRVGRVLGRFKMAKHFETTITATAFRYARQSDAIAQEARLGGIYVIRTSVPEPILNAHTAVERAFRCLKTVDLYVRPIHHRLSERVRAHVFVRAMQRGPERARAHAKLDRPVQCCAEVGPTW